MHARLSGIVDGPDTPAELRDGPRPDWGDTKGEIEGITENGV